MQTVHSEEIGSAADDLLQSGFKTGKLLEPQSITNSAPRDACRRSMISYKKSGRGDEELSVSRQALRSGLNGLVHAFAEYCMIMGNKIGGVLFLG